MMTMTEEDPQLDQGPERCGESQWYYVQNNRPAGPLSFAQMTELIVAGRLAPTDLVLQILKRKLTVAGNVKAFFPTGSPLEVALSHEDRLPDCSDAGSAGRPRAGRR